jgi:hypothetical protein
MVGAIEQVLSALNASRVRYLVVVEVAVVLHGHLRATADLDLVVQLGAENALGAVRALESLGFRPVEVDLFASEPLDFEAAYARSVRVQLTSTARRNCGATCASRTPSVCDGWKRPWRPSVSGRDSRAVVPHPADRPAPSDKVP